LARDIVVAGTERGKQVALECINPKDLPTPEMYTQVVVATGSKLVFVSGQQPEDIHGKLVSDGDFAAQARLAFGNLGRSNVKTPAQYIASLPADRAKTIAAVRALVNKHVPRGYDECLVWGTIGWTIPLSRYPDTYNKQPICTSRSRRRRTTARCTWRFGVRVSLRS
jgi:hypothetical protein